MTRRKDKHVEVRQLEEKWKKALADYQNLEKRFEKEKESFVKFANSKLILKILDGLDALEKAEEHLKDEGLTLAVASLKKVLENEGLEKIKTKGEIFNPEEMECIEVAKGEKGKVLKETKPGYKMEGKVLRVAQVKVGGKK